MPTDYYAQSDQAIGQDLGRRLRALRLRQDRTQEELAHRAAISIGTIKALEAGKGKLETLIAVLRELGALEALDGFIQEPALSPLQLARRRGRSRERASGRHGKAPGDHEDEGTPSW